MFNNAKLKDGTLDNGIIAHEWGHYISNRLVGNSAGLINF
nr:M36 family metallopeptidase [Pseudoalteromonas ostreae]